ncbi:MAG TPA: hypothetical protein VIX80_10465, partial [Candidatus Kapabacteria bacterium]
MTYNDFLKGLPPQEMWGERIYYTSDFSYPESLNAGVELLDRNIERGFGARPAIYFHDQVITYNQLLETVGKMSNALASLGI